MAARSADRRAAIAARLADHMLARGLSGSSLRSLAGAAQLSDRMLLYYFADKAEAVAAALGEVARRMTAELGGQAAGRPVAAAELRARLLPVLLAERLWPFMRLWLEIAARAGNGDAFCRRVGGEIGRGFLAWTAAQLDSPTPEARAAEAAALLVAAEGMVLLKSLGLDDVCALALEGPG